VETRERQKDERGECFCIFRDLILLRCKDQRHIGLKEIYAGGSGR